MTKKENPLPIADKEEPFVFETKKTLHLTDEENPHFR